MYLIIHQTENFACLIFVVGSCRRKIFNGENGPIYGTSKSSIVYMLWPDSQPPTRLEAGRPVWKLAGRL